MMETTTKEDNVHPSLLDNVSTEKIIKLLKFGIWVKYQMRINKSISFEDIISNELTLYQDDIGIKSELVVRTLFMFSL
jgi:hypothetical protein